MAFKKGIKSGYYNPPDFAKHKWILTESFDTKGKSGIKYRSSWELKFMEFCSYNDSILKCNSEGIIIPYVSPVDGKMHNYYMDFIVETKQSIFLIEVKPKAQCLPPKPPKNKSEKSLLYYKKSVETYAINRAKWEAAELMAEENGWKFMIINETHLGV